MYSFWHNGEKSLKTLLSGSRFRYSAKFNRFFLVTQQTCSPSFVQIHPYRWDIVLSIVFGTMATNHLKNLSIRIWIRIFTKIESIIRCYTHNMSTKFCPIPSITFWDIMLYVIFGPITQWCKNHEKKFSYPGPYSDLHQNLINSSLSHTQPVYQIWPNHQQPYQKSRYLVHRWAN